MSIDLASLDDSGQQVRSMIINGVLVVQNVGNNNASGPLLAEVIA